MKGNKIAQMATIGTVGVTRLMIFLRVDEVLDGSRKERTSRVHHESTCV